MKRTSVILPAEALSRVTREAERRGVSTAAIVREAVEAYLPPPDPGRRLAFFAVGEGESSDSRDIDEIVGRAIDRELRDG